MQIIINSAVFTEYSIFHDWHPHNAFQTLLSQDGISKGENATQNNRDYDAEDARLEDEGREGWEADVYKRKEALPAGSF